MCSFFLGATFLKRFLEHIKLSRRLGCNKITHTSLLGEAKRIRTHQNFQKIFLKIPQEHIRFSRRKKYHKSRSNFLEKFSQILKNTYNFPGDHWTDILQNFLGNFNELRRIFLRINVKNFSINYRFNGFNFLRIVLRENPISLGYLHVFLYLRFKSFKTFILQLY